MLAMMANLNDEGGRSSVPWLIAAMAHPRNATLLAGPSAGSLYLRARLTVSAVLGPELIVSSWAPLATYHGPFYGIVTKSSSIKYGLAIRVCSMTSVGSEPRSMPELFRPAGRNVRIGTWRGVTTAHPPPRSRAAGRNRVSSLGR